MSHNFTLNTPDDLHECNIDSNDIEIINDTISIITKYFFSKSRYDK